MNSINKYPEELVSNDRKKSFEFGREYASAIWSEWQSQLSTQTKNYSQFRKYAHGKQSVDNCRKNMQRKYIKEEHYLIDWNNKLRLMPQLLRNFYNSVDMNEFSPIIRAIDPAAMEIRNKRKEDKLKLFYAKDFIQQNADNAGGSSIIPLDQVPQSKEQIDLEEQTAKPLRIERGEEKALQFIMLDNRFKQTQIDVLKDAVELNIMVSKVYTDPVEGIKIDYVDPFNFIYQKSRGKFHHDSNYFAEVKSITIGQFRNIAKASGLIITDEQIRKIARISDRERINGNLKIRVMYYTFRTFFMEVYKKKTNPEKNTVTLIDRTKDIGTEKEYNPSRKSPISEKIMDNYDVWFEGIMCLDDDNTIIQHQLASNLAEYKGKILPPYVVCTPREMSFVEENKELIDSIQELRYRIIHHRNTLKGIITEIDPDTIATLSFGEEKIPPKEVLSLYFTQYISFRKSKDEDGDPLNAPRAINEIPTGIPQSLIALMEQFVNEVQMLYQAFGTLANEQQRPDPKTLSDLEPYRLSENTAMRDYIDCLFDFSLTNLQIASARLNDAIEWDHIRDKFIDNIGLEDFSAIEQYRNDRKDHYFSLYLDYVPTKKERALMDQNIMSYVNQGLLDPFDAMEISAIRNIRTAVSTLRLRLQEKQRNMNDFELQKIREQQNSTITASRVSNEEKRKTEQFTYQLRAQEKELEFQREAFLLQKQGEIKIQEASMRENNKQAVEEFRANFTADQNAFKKEQDRLLRNEIQDKSARNQAELIKIRKGEKENLGDEGPSEPVNLSNI
ncbi:hypothetical protein [uncultured Chryseobacterium sp.]|uniref:hypothetical protein n=1 Tax=uncultured Chryseobacterium sp. TaxID=259322 RepID=UPI0025DD18E2|nr:hypothetical protein [uncultured Chryseobacterium sp.]